MNKDRNQLRKNEITPINEYEFVKVCLHQGTLINYTQQLYTNPYKIQWNTNYPKEN